MCFLHNDKTMMAAPVDWMAALLFIQFFTRRCLKLQLHVHLARRLIAMAARALLTRAALGAWDTVGWLWHRVQRDAFKTAQGLTADGDKAGQCIGEQCSMRAQQSMLIYAQRPHEREQRSNDSAKHARRPMQRAPPAPA
jgi:hypothetical protein